MDAISPFHRAIYLTGPTAVGKTAVGVELARRLNAEIIALDSMTLYRGMDIGTAKPTLEERRGVPHHLIDVIGPWETVSVALYRNWARDVLADLEARGKPALFVGGTPMYLLTLLRGLFEGPGADPEVRRRLEAEADEVGDAHLHARLSQVDPVTAARLHVNDRRRIVRALEVFEITGRPLRSFQDEHDRPAQGVSVFALDLPRPELHRRINQRVVNMFEVGLVAEVERLMSAERPLGPTARQGVGYAEGIDLLEGRADLPSTIARIQARTRQFAKRQMTWFRGLEEVRFWPIEPGFEAARIAEQLATAIDHGSSCVFKT